MVEAKEHVAVLRSGLCLREHEIRVYIMLAFPLVCLDGEGELAVQCRELFVERMIGTELCLGGLAFSPIEFLAGNKLLTVPDKGFIYYVKRRSCKQAHLVPYLEGSVRDLGRILADSRLETYLLRCQVIEFLFNIIAA